MRKAGWIISGAVVLVIVTVVLVVGLVSRAITGAPERSSMADLEVSVRAIHYATLQARRDQGGMGAQRETSTLMRYLGSHNHRVLSTKSNGQNLTLELLVWTEKEAEFDLSPTLVTCLRVTSTPKTVSTSAIPCSVDTHRHGKLVTAVTPETDPVAIRVPQTTPPCYSGTGRCN